MQSAIAENVPGMQDRMEGRAVVCGGGGGGGERV